MIAVMIICSGLNIGIAFLTGNVDADMEVRKISSVFSVALSFVFIFAYFALCMFLRVKKQKAILSGLVLYQFVGFFAFIFHLILLMAGEESFLSIAATKVFYWWSLPYHEAGVWVMNLVHFHLRYILMLFVGMMTYVTVKSLRGIQLDNAFEKKIQEKKETEAQAEEEAKTHRIITAKEVDDYNSSFNQDG